MFDIRDFLDESNEHAELLLEKRLKEIEEYENKCKVYEVYIVNGAPGSGKTKFVEEHKMSGDLVFDFDRICAALGGTSELYEDHTPYIDVAVSVRGTVYDAIEYRRGEWKNAYVITTENDESKLNKLAERLKAKVVNVLADKEKCINNIMNDDRRKDKEMYVKLVEKWFDNIKQ